MKTYGTKIQAINPITRELTTYCGPNIQALSPGLAHEYCQTHELGYCEIDGIVEAEIPCNENYKADWNNIITHPDLQLN